MNSKAWTNTLEALGFAQSEGGKKIELEKSIEKEKLKLMEIQNNPEYDDDIGEDIRQQISKLNDDISVRQECIDLLRAD